MIEYFGNLSQHLGLPINSASHGHMIDNMIGWVHWLMLILFVGWGAFFIITIIKFGINNSKDRADYEGVKNHYSTYGEYGVILFVVQYAYSISAVNLRVAFVVP